MSENKNIDNKNIEDLDNDFLNLGLDSNNELDFDLIENYLNKSEEKKPSKPSFLDGTTASISPHIPEDKKMPNIAPEKSSGFLSSDDLLKQLKGVEETVKEEAEKIVSQDFEIDDSFFKADLPVEISVKPQESTVIPETIMPTKQVQKPSETKYIISQFQEEDLNAFKISSSSDSAKLEDSTKDTIHINVGSSTYGWNVNFINGVVMSLNDMRTYQNRNKKLLSDSGKITYGIKVFEFSKIRKITFYENPKYFSYIKLK